MANDGFDRPVALPLGIDRMADWFKSRERGIVLIAVLMHLIILVSMIGLRMIPNQEMELSVEDTIQVMRAIEAIEDMDDVQNVYSNLNVSEAAMAAMEG